MSLLIHDEICINADIGVCKIQLCIGDITKLPKEESVDVLVVSAFPGDYSPTRASLIGALYYNLGVSVRDLSRDKAEDLREQYFCWWSKRLPEHLSFKRLLCFEGGFGVRRRKPPAVIGAVFRCLVPILNNEEGSVMMPFLATGDQGYSKKLVLRQTIGSAVHWMKAGLPLRNLKIVLFSRRPEVKDKALEPLMELFQELKERYRDQEEAEKEEPVEEQPPDTLYDIYLSYSMEDRSVALKVAQYLKVDSNLRVFHEVQELDEEESWQKDIFNVMVKCTRVVPLLGPGFLKSDGCIEQYNMALCLNRRCHREILAPMYIATVEILPTYMSLIQYIDCRPRDMVKMKEASESIIQWMNSYRQKCQMSIERSLSSSPKPPSQTYDVFISYCHANKTKALKVLEALKHCKPDLNIFIDTTELKTGTSWQQTLYTALDSSKRMLALLSPDYAASKVCREEFALALALHADKHSSLQLHSLLVLPLDHLPDWCSVPLPVECTVDFDQKISSVCQEFVRRLSDSSPTSDDALTERFEQLTHKEISLELDITSQFRKFCFVTRKRVLNPPVNYCSTEKPKQSEDEGQPSEGHECDIALSYAAQDAHFARVLKDLLLRDMPHLKLSEPQNNQARFGKLDKARLIVALLSPAFVASKELMDELNIAMHRCRAASKQLLFPIHVAELPIKPSYMHLLPCEVSILDLSWAWKVLDPWSREEVERLAEAHDVSTDSAFCLKSSSAAIAEHLNGSPAVEIPGQVLLNITEVKRGWNEVLRRLQGQDGHLALKNGFGVTTISVSEARADTGSGETPEKGVGVTSGGAESHRDEVVREEGSSVEAAKEEGGVNASSGNEMSAQEARASSRDGEAAQKSQGTLTTTTSKESDDKMVAVQHPRNNQCCYII